MHEDIGVAHCYRSLNFKVGGGLFSIGIVTFMNPDHSGLQFRCGIVRFHIDLDFMFIAHPENEVRNDKQINKLEYNDENIEYRSWFFGYEGIGIYRKYSQVAENGISQLEIGAHPLCCIGLTNIYHPSTQQAVVGIQFANLQISIHSAIDQKL